ncbi:transcriptional regulator FtsR [Paraoerskovia marina]|nr:MerR family transcriptional regulator [Paraoerskovia marina]
MRISDVLTALRPDFPGVSHSKLRFLEEQGLIEPVRTNAGYRQYSPADVERLRFVLVEQRDSYLPLKVIKERLHELDDGGTEHAPGPRIAGTPAEAAPSRYTTESLAAAAGVQTEFVDSLVEAGVLRRSPGGQHDAASLEILRLASALAEYGVEARHLRSLRTASDRHVSLVQQIVAPWRSQQSPSARAHAGTMAAEVGETCARLHRAWVHEGISDLTS